MYATRKFKHDPADVVVRLRTRWALLAAMLQDLRERGVCLPPDLLQELTVARLLIGAGSLGQGEPQRRIARLEGRLVSIGYALGPVYLDGWFDLLRQAATGELAEDDLQTVLLPRPAEVRAPLEAAPALAAA